MQILELASISADGSEYVPETAVLDIVVTDIQVSQVRVLCDCLSYHVETFTSNIVVLNVEKFQ